MKPSTSGGGWKAIRYTFRMANQAGWLPLWRAMRSRNACKTCALGMGGQKGGMVNEAGHFPEVCKKSVQAKAARHAAGISPDFFATLLHRRSCDMLSPASSSRCGRLVVPVIAGPGRHALPRHDWDEALDRAARERCRRRAPDGAFFYASGRSSNEAGFLLQLFARAYGTNNVNNCSYYCHQASGVGLSQALGTGTATVGSRTSSAPTCCLLIGANPASNHPRLMRS